MNELYARAMRQEDPDQAGSLARGQLMRERIVPKGSVEYLLRGNLVNLVLAVVIGVAFWSLIRALAARSSRRSPARSSPGVKSPVFISRSTTA